MTFLIIILVSFIIFGSCNNRLYKLLEKHEQPTSSSIHGPGPDILFRYVAFCRRTNRPIELSFYIGLAALVTAIATLVWAVISF